MAVLLLLGFLAYANTIDGGFVWDDASSILLHQHVKNPAKVFALFTEDQHAFAGGQGNFYRPLLSVTFMVDYAVSRIGQEHLPPSEIPHDLSPVVFHVSSILWHCAAGILLMLFMARVGASKALAVIIPAIFVLHPLQTEAVAYISGRADSMSAAFMFAGLYFATWRESRRRFYAGAALTILCFVAALLSKESAFIFPALLALYIFLLANQQEAMIRGIRRATRYLPLVASLVVLGVYALLRMTVLNFGSDSTPPASGFGQRIIETFQAFALYLKLFFVPTHLHMERTLSGVPVYVAGIGAALFLALLGLLVFALRRGERRAAFGLAWFLVTWLPISGVFPLNAPMAEHWMYVPMVGFFWGFGELIVPRLGSGRVLASRPAIRVAAAVVALWALSLLMLTVARNRDWASNESLYTATLRENPNSIRVNFNLAVTYQDLLNNPVGARRRYDAVVRAYRKRKEANPDLRKQFWQDELEAHLSLGDIYRGESRYQEALSHYQYVLQAVPEGPNKGIVAQAAFGAGCVFLESGEYPAALEYFRRAAQIVPDLGIEADRLMTNEAPLARFTLGAEAPPNTISSNQLQN